MIYDYTVNYFMNQPPSVVTYHAFVTLTLKETFKVQYILMKVLYLLLEWASKFFLKLWKWTSGVKTLGENPATYFAIVLDQT